MAPRFPILLLAALACLTVSAGWASAESAGESVWDVGGGVGFPINGLDIAAFGGGSERPGSIGVALSPRYLYQASANLGLGAEITYMDFPGHSVSLPGGPAAASGDLLGFEAVARYLLHEQGPTPYLVAGVGLARYAVTVSQGPTTVLDAKTTGLTLFPGVGVKTDLGERAEAMAELRWQAGSAGRAQFGTSVYNALGLFLRLGWRR